MKGIDIFCASQAATAICLSMDEASSSSSPYSTSTILLGGGLGSGRAIDRCNPIISDSRRISKPIPLCSSEPASIISPKPHNSFQKLHHRKDEKNPSNGDKYKHDQTKKKKIRSRKTGTDEKRKSSTADEQKDESAAAALKSRWSCTKPGNFISPPGSTRYLLNRERAEFLEVLSDFDPVLKLVPHVETSRSHELVKAGEEFPAKPPSSAAFSDQVVVLRVSLHCRGCERKMRKHISRMEGVTSFNIDFAAKKVTVVGDVTPLGVLASISKVKNAQLWSSPSPPPPSNSLPSLHFPNPDDLNNNQPIAAA